MNNEEHGLIETRVVFELGKWNLKGIFVKD